MALARKSVAADVLRDKFHLTGHFRVAEIYNPDNPGLYVREMYGNKLPEFHQKFFVDPLERDVHQTIGAVWSTHSGGSEGRGHGKSMLMAEESKIVNQDFGAQILAAADATEEAITEHPFIAGYCSFEESKGIKTFPAALLEAVAFALRCRHGKDNNVHQELRRRIATSLNADPQYEAEAIKQALLRKLAGYENLMIQFSHKQVAGFIDALCGDDTAVVSEFIREKVGPRVRAAQGFHFVHVFNALASLAGIVHVIYFVDQIENFAKHARHQDRDVRILRESMCQTSPTAEMASFVFQMHINAMHVLEPIWQAEHLPSLDYQRAMNRGRVVDLHGLKTPAEARKVVQALFKQKRPKDSKPPSPLHPFDDDSLEVVRQATDGNPRRFLELIDTLLFEAKKAGNGAYDQAGLLDLTFVRSIADDAAGAFAGEEAGDEDDLTNLIQ